MDELDTRGIHVDPYMPWTAQHSSYGSHGSSYGDSYQDYSFMVKIDCSGDPYSTYGSNSNDPYGCYTDYLGNHYNWYNELDSYGGHDSYSPYSYSPYGNRNYYYSYMQTGEEDLDYLDDIMDMQYGDDDLYDDPYM